VSFAASAFPPFTSLSIPSTAAFGSSLSSSSSPRSGMARNLAAGLTAQPILRRRVRHHHLEDSQVPVRRRGGPACGRPFEPTECILGRDGVQVKATENRQDHPVQRVSGCAATL
jgi:hypothetical protein